MDIITEKFEAIGARVNVAPFRPGFGSTASHLTEQGVRGRLHIDVRTDRRGEFFDLRVAPGVTLEALDVRPRDRHLVLLARGEELSRFLCGHDERHWFVAAIPESSPVTTVAQGKAALQPPAVRENARRLRRKHRNRRRNPRFVHQGEWFFVPAPEFVPGTHRLRDEGRAHHAQPAQEAPRRGGGRPHRAERLGTSSAVPRGGSTET